MGWIILKHADDANDCGWKNSRALIDSGWQRSWKWRIKVKNRKLVNWRSFIDFAGANRSKQQSKFIELKKRNPNISLNSAKRSSSKCQFNFKRSIKYIIKSLICFSTNSPKVIKSMLNCEQTPSINDGTAKQHWQLITNELR